MCFLVFVEIWLGMKILHVVEENEEHHEFSYKLMVVDGGWDGCFLGWTLNFIVFMMNTTKVGGWHGGVRWS